MPVPNPTGSQRDQRSRSSNSPRPTPPGMLRARISTAVQSICAYGKRTRTDDGAIAMGAGLLEAAPTLAGLSPDRSRTQVMADNSTPVLRFAPSPTGYLHI